MYRKYIQIYHNNPSKNYSSRDTIPLIIPHFISRSNSVVMIYLACDAAYLGLLAALWTMVFFTERSDHFPASVAKGYKNVRLSFLFYFGLTPSLQRG
jgi:hypothetical protein